LGFGFGFGGWRVLFAAVPPAGNETINCDPNGSADERGAQRRGRNRASERATTLGWGWSIGVGVLIVITIACTIIIKTSRSFTIGRSHISIFCGSV
jgi:hypothetical protein